MNAPNKKNPLGIPSEEALEFPFYFHPPSNYFMKNNRGRFIEVNKETINSTLEIDHSVGKDADRKRAVLKIQKDQDVDYAGTLAGHKIGLHEKENGARMLVTSEARLIEPRQGSFPVINQVIKGLLQDDTQITYLKSWLKLALEALHSGSTRGGQALVMCGPRGCGKSLLKKIMVQCLGGRQASPYGYMVGNTKFNSDLFRAECLVIDDETHLTDIRSRLQFGTTLKQLTAGSDEMAMTIKHAESIPATPLWRVMVCLNDEPENIQALPPLDGSIDDKLIILRAFSQEMPMPTTSREEYQVFWKTLESELPAFVFYLLNEFEIPKEIEHARFGIRHFHERSVMEHLKNLSPEMRLLELIDASLWESFDSTEHWEGSSMDLEKILKGFSSSVQGDAKSLLHHGTATGTYLGRLEKSTRRVSKLKKVNGTRVWKIDKP